MRLIWKPVDVDYSEELLAEWNSMFGFDLVRGQDVVMQASVPGGILLQFRLGTGGAVVFLPDVTSVHMQQNNKDFTEK